tara:strand:- start:55 stop:273 length:219 start_codon:yes stop_codon:yes gene_type:complete
MTMSNKKVYLTKTLWERNSNNGLELHDTLEEAGASIGADMASGALYVRLFECTEVEYETFTTTKVQITGVTE